MDSVLLRNGLALGHLVVGHSSSGASAWPLSPGHQLLLGCRLVFGHWVEVYRIQATCDPRNRRKPSVMDLKILNIGLDFQNQASVKKESFQDNHMRIILLR